MGPEAWVEVGLEPLGVAAVAEAELAGGILGREHAAGLTEVGFREAAVAVDDGVRCDVPGGRILSEEIVYYGPCYFFRKNASFVRWGNS
jgi:hypothetical protein